MDEKFSDNTPTAGYKGVRAVGSVKYWGGDGGVVKKNGDRSVSLDETISSTETYDLG